jgi:hypothetical protein
LRRSSGTVTWTVRPSGRQSYSIVP